MPLLCCCLWSCLNSNTVRANSSVTKGATNKSVLQGVCTTNLLVAPLVTELLALTVILSGLGGGIAATAVARNCRGFLAKCANGCILLPTNLA